MINLLFFEMNLITIFIYKSFLQKNKPDLITGLFCYFIIYEDFTNSYKKMNYYKNICTHFLFQDP